jgi:hypothetical protein
VSHGRYVVFQMAEVAIPRQMFQEILRLIAELRPQPPPRQHEAFDCHAFKRNRQEECVQMPVKIARSAPRPSFGELLVAIHTSRQSCCKAGKARIFTPVRDPGLYQNLTHAACRPTGTSIAKTYGGSMGYRRGAQARTVPPMSQCLRSLVLCGQSNRCDSEKEKRDDER